MSSNTIQRCPWSKNDPLMRRYHDEEWGVPVRESRALWEMLILEGFQAGLSWQTILRRREGFRKAFKGFKPEVVARFGEKDIARLMADEGIIRARGKIEATISNARVYLAMK
ncbi:MAG: DNA-3-methyladenine glycosylase I, partial [Chthoniobacterales bacterium]